MRASIAGDLLGTDEVDLVDEDHVAEGDLLDRLVALREVGFEVDRIDDGDEGIELDVGLDLVGDEEGRGDGRGIGEPGRLDEDAVERAGAFLQAWRACRLGRRARCSRGSRC